MGMAILRPMKRMLIKEAHERLRQKLPMVLRGNLEKRVGSRRLILLKNNTVLREAELDSIERQGFKTVLLADESPEQEDHEIIQGREFLTDWIFDYWIATKTFIENSRTPERFDIEPQSPALRDATEKFITLLQAELNLTAYLPHLDIDLEEPYGHYVRVAAYSSMLTTKLMSDIVQEKVLRGFSVESSSRRQMTVTLGALLHDIGKEKNVETVRRFKEEARFTPEQREESKKHAAEGFEILGILNEPALRALARNHHQHFDGSGFPANVDGSARHGVDIDFFSRIVCVANTFDNLMRHRFGERPMIPAVALYHLRNTYKTWFDPRVLREFLAIVPPFQLGDEVLLSNGLLAKVLKQRGDTPCLPRVAILKETEPGRFQRHLEMELVGTPLRVVGYNGMKVDSLYYDNLSKSELLPVAGPTGKA